MRKPGRSFPGADEVECEFALRVQLHPCVLCRVRLLILSSVQTILGAHPIEASAARHLVFQPLPDTFRMVGKNEAACAADATREVVER